MTVVSYEALDGGIAVLRMDDGKANAISPALVEDLGAALDKALEDEQKAIVLAGREGRFCAGFDLKVVMSGPDAARDLFRSGAELLLTIYEYPLPVVAAVTGHALAGGALMAAVCDQRVGAAGSFKIGLNEVSIGIPLPIFGHAIARDRLDARHLSAATLEATVYRPDQAVEVGWLDETADPDALMDAALAHAKRLAALSGKPYRITKRSLRAATLQHIRDTLEDDLADIAEKMA